MSSLSTLPLSAQEFRTMLDLLEKQPWLKDRYDSLEDLLSLCQSYEKQRLIIELLHRFYYLEQDNLILLLQKCKDQIQVEWGLPENKTYIAALHNDADADSSQAAVQMLKAKFSEGIPWSSSKFYNSAFKAIAQAGSNIENIVLVDEFIGSGEQAKGVITSISNRVTDSQKKINIYVLAIASMEQSQESVSGLVKEFWSSLWFKRGISDFYTGTELDSAISNMKELEGLLSPQNGIHLLQPFGYKRSEALFKYALGTTPDNVFPVFHWKWLADNTVRRTILPPRA